MEGSCRAAKESKEPQGLHTGQIRTKAAEVSCANPQVGWLGHVLERARCSVDWDSKQNASSVACGELRCLRGVCIQACFVASPTPLAALCCVDSRVLEASEASAKTAPERLERCEPDCRPKSEVLASLPPNTATLPVTTTNLHHSTG